MHEPGDDPIAALACAGMPPPLTRPDTPPEAHEDAFDPLLRAAAAPSPLGPSGLRRRLLERIAASAAGARTLYTRRHADTQAVEVAPGAALRTLYRASGPLRRPGEPEAVMLVELAQGAAWAGPDAFQALQHECLVLQGGLQVGESRLRAHDYHVVPAGTATGPWFAAGGALLYLRQSRPREGAPTRPASQAAAGAEWADYAPGIKRRVLWRQGAQAAMLYHALPGAAVPHHGHHHDEECLMLAGDFFLDEVLLRPLDYQIAPAGTEHRLASTDTGVVIYAHGDVDLDVR